MAKHKKHKQQHKRSASTSLANVLSPGDLARWEAVHQQLRAIDATRQAYGLQQEALQREFKLLAAEAQEAARKDGALMAEFRRTYCLTDADHIQWPDGVIRRGLPQAPPVPQPEPSPARKPRAKKPAQDLAAAQPSQQQEAAAS